MSKKKVEAWVNVLGPFASCVTLSKANAVACQRNCGGEIVHLTEDPLAKAERRVVRAAEKWADAGFNTEPARGRELDAAVAAMKKARTK